MATRHSDSMAIVRRARALKPMGWQVEKNSAGQYKLTPPASRVTERPSYMVHLTYSDVWSIKNLMQDLDAAGFSEDEQTLKSNRLKQNALKLAAEREAANKRAAEIAANNTAMLYRAAGNYLVEPEECDLHWLTEKHPAPQVKCMYITPKAAEYILEHHNTDNRKRNDSDSKRYAEIILSGQWKLTHQGLAFDTRGLVQDAQHRLYGLVLAGEAVDDDGEVLAPDLKVPFYVFVGMPVENFTAIDEGRLRTAAQMLEKAGHANAAVLNAIMRAVEIYDSGSVRKRSLKFTQQMAFDKQKENPELWRKAQTMALRAYRQTGRVIPKAPFGAAYYLIARANGEDNVYVKAFFQAVLEDRKWRTNMVLPKDDPRAAVLNKFRRAAMSSGRRTTLTPIEGAMWIVIAWNHLVTGHHVSDIRFPVGAPAPRILVCKPGVAGAGAPRAFAGELAGLDEHGNEIEGH